MRPSSGTGCGSQTPAGEAWRCLRCATYVVGPPKGSGPADDAPEVPRGRLLRDRVGSCVCSRPSASLRGLGLVALAVLVLLFRNSRENLHQSFNHDLPLLRPLADQIGWNIDSSKVVRSINRGVLAVTDHAGLDRGRPCSPMQPCSSSRRPGCG